MSKRVKRENANRKHRKTSPVPNTRPSSGPLKLRFLARVRWPSMYRKQLGQTDEPYRISNPTLAKLFNLRKDDIFLQIPQVVPENMLSAYCTVPSVGKVKGSKELAIWLRMFEFFLSLFCFTHSLGLLASHTRISTRPTQHPQGSRNRAGLLPCRTRKVQSAPHTSQCLKRSRGDSR